MMRLFFPGTLNADRRPFRDFFEMFFPCHYDKQLLLVSALPTLVPRMRLIYYTASKLIMVDMMWRKKEKISAVFSHWEFGDVCSPPWSCISWLLLTFVSKAQYDLTSTDFCELFPHLFSLSPFCSAILVTLEYISFIPNLGSLHCPKCFMATCFRALLLRPNLCSNVSFLERMSLTMFLKKTSFIMFSILLFLVFSILFIGFLYHFAFCL